MSLICKQCGKSFTSSRPDALYCSSNCRKQASRKVRAEKSVTREVKKAITTEIEEVQFQTDGITVKGKFIPEEELNWFYRGKKGKISLAMDLVHVKYFNVDPILYTEKARLEKMQKKVKMLR